MRELQSSEYNMERRSLLAAAGAMALASLTGCRLRDTPAAERPSDSTARDIPAFEFEEATIGALTERMAQGSLTAERLTQAYLDRIRDVDQKLQLRSVIEVNPDALSIARALDAERRAGRIRGPLHGIPILIKDNIDTADRMRTSAGSLALADTSAPKDAFIVERLRAAGAVLLGKTNLSEWANIRSSHSVSGWSGRGGQTRNPYALDRNPCGSSSGTGAAIAANLAVIGIGTETDGSIVCPSNANGLVGIKPTVGLWSRSGIIPISHTQDTPGPMARTVRDAAVLLDLLTAADPRDPATSLTVSRMSSADALDPKALAGARVGVARQFFGFSGHVDAVMKQALDALRSAGAVLVDPVEIPHQAEIGAAESQVLRYELKADMAAYLATRGATTPHKSLADLIAFNEQNASREMPYFAQETFVEAQALGPLSDPKYRQALATCRRLSREEGIDRMMRLHRLDAIVAPTGGPAWVIDYANGDHFSGGSSSPAAVAGYPAVTVPAGEVFGLPVGIAFFGKAWSESTLVRYAYAFEQIVNARKRPRFLDQARA